MTPSKTLFYAGVSLVAGVGLQSLFPIPWMLTWGIFLLGALVFSMGLPFGRKGIVVASLCLIFLALGILRMQVAQYAIAADPLSRLNDHSGKVTFAGQVSDGPDVRDDAQKLVVKADGSGSLVLVTIPREPQYHYLDRVRLTGKLKTPAVFGDFNYKEYLLKDGIVSVMDYPATQLVSRGQAHGGASWIYSRVLAAKETLRVSLGAIAPSPEKSILEGVLLGQNGNMPQFLREELNRAGVRHLTAISGLHIVIVSSLLMVLLLAIGLWRQQALYFALALVWLYIALVGFPASGVRAGIMGSMLLFSQQLGRQYAGTRMLVLAAASMLLQNPMLLRYDAGFQLSFLATLGIILLHPVFSAWLSFFTKWHLAAPAEIMSVSLSAQIFTLPIMVANFGTVSLIAPVANILILPVVPFIMGFGFVAVIAGAVSHGIGFLLSLPCLALVAYLLKVLQIFGQPWAAAPISSIPLWVPAVYYAGLLWAATYVHRRKLASGF